MFLPCLLNKKNIVLRNKIYHHPENFLVTENNRNSLMLKEVTACKSDEEKRSGKIEE
jgi:hypothetical protein